MIPLLEPFGSSLGKKISDPDLRKKYAFTELYDSTKTAALNFPQANRYISVSYTHLDVYKRQGL